MGWFEAGLWMIDRILPLIPIVGHADDAENYAIGAHGDIDADDDSGDLVMDDDDDKYDGDDD